MGRRNDLRINTSLPQDLETRFQASMQKAFFKHGSGSFFSSEIVVDEFESAIKHHTISNMARSLLAGYMTSEVIDIEEDSFSETSTIDGESSEFSFCDNQADLLYSPINWQTGLFSPLILIEEETSYNLLGVY